MENCGKAGKLGEMLRQRGENEDPVWSVWEADVEEEEEDGGEVVVREWPSAVSREASGRG